MMTATTLAAAPARESSCRTTHYHPRSRSGTPLVEPTHHSHPLKLTFKTLLTIVW